MTSPENAPWGFLEWAVAGLVSIGASAGAFVWRLMTRLHTLEIAVRQHRHDLDVAQSANESALLRLVQDYIDMGTIFPVPSTPYREVN